MVMAVSMMIPVVELLVLNKRMMDRGLAQKFVSS